MADLTADEQAILAYLAGTDDAGFVSLRGMFAEDKAVLPREDFDRDDWERWVELYFAVARLLALGLVDGVAADGGGHPNRFRITGAGRLAAGPAQPPTPNGASGPSGQGAAAGTGATLRARDATAASGSRPPPSSPASEAHTADTTEDRGDQ